jgi:hypothetical protein
MHPLENLTREDRARIAVHLRRFIASLQRQRRFDAEVAASLERLARNPAFRKRLLALDSQFSKRIFNE